MRKTKLTLVSIFAFIALIGVAWASWTFSNAEENAGIDIELSDYTDAGSVVFTNTPTTYALDTTAAMAAAPITFDIEHQLDVSHTPTGTVAYSVTASIEDAALAAYLVINVDDSLWNSANSVVQITITFSWATDKEPTNVAEYEALETILNNAGAAAVLNITATVIYS